MTRGDDRGVFDVGAKAAMLCVGAKWTVGIGQTAGENSSTFPLVSEDSTNSLTTCVLRLCLES